MAMFWNLLQDHRFFKLRERADSAEKRIKALEKEMSDLRDLLKKLLYALEDNLGQDIDSDGRIGRPPKKRYVARKKPVSKNKPRRKKTGLKE